jgi:hypothetical protein
MVSWQLLATNVIIKAPGQAAAGTIPPGAIVVDNPPAPPATATQEEKETYAKEVGDFRANAGEALRAPLVLRGLLRCRRQVVSPSLRSAIGPDTIEEAKFAGSALTRR